MSARDDGNAVNIITEQRCQIAALSKELRRYALVNNYRDRKFGGISWGLRCRLCGTTWQRDTPEVHRSNCALEGTQDEAARHGA